jgi:hypothetical protein
VLNNASIPRTELLAEAPLHAFAGADAVGIIVARLAGLSGTAEVEFTFLDADTIVAAKLKCTFGIREAFLAQSFLTRADGNSRKRNEYQKGNKDNSFHTLSSHVFLY